jgi:hypothetical protein
MFIIQSYTDLDSDNYFVMKHFSGVRVINVILCVLFQFVLSIIFQYIINNYVSSPFEHPVSNEEPPAGILQKSSTSLYELSRIFTTNKDFEKSQTIDSEYSKLTLKFKIPSREQKYQEYMISKRKNHYKTYLIIFTLILIILACVRGTHSFPIQTNLPLLKPTNRFTSDPKQVASKSDPSLPKHIFSFPIRRLANNADLVHDFINSTI